LKSTSQKLVTVGAYVLGVLSIAAGIPKLLQMPQELAFLSSLGIAGTAVSALGVIQLAGGILLFPSKTRLVGAGVAALIFGISCAALFIGGDITMGIVSLLPFAAAIGVGLGTRKR
jgi:hypothetical protein